MFDWACPLPADASSTSSANEGPACVDTGRLVISRRKLARNRVTVDCGKALLLFEMEEVQYFMKCFTVGKTRKNSIITTNPNKSWLCGILHSYEWKRHSKGSKRVLIVQTREGTDTKKKIKANLSVPRVLGFCFLNKQHHWITCQLRAATDRIIFFTFLPSHYLMHVDRLWVSQGCAWVEMKNYTGICGDGVKTFLC